MSVRYSQLKQGTYLIWLIYNLQSILFFLYTSEKIANRPCNTHPCRNSKSKKKSIPSIFQCLHCISLYNTVHTVIKCASWNERNHGCDEKGSRSLFADSCKNFRIHICNKTSQQCRKKNTSPQTLPKEKDQPAKKTTGSSQRQIFSFHVKKKTKSHRSDSSGNQLYNRHCDQSPNLPKRIIAPIKPSASAAARSNAAISLIIPERVSPMSTSRIALVDISPGIRSIISPIMILSM